jgi:gamma-glutamyltranspeptidase/glutathione hydrolase
MESDGWSEADADTLRAFGHEVTLIEPRTSATGWAQVIRRLPDGSYQGGADPRADSLAAGL